MDKVTFCQPEDFKFWENMNFMKWKTEIKIWNEIFWKMIIIID